MKEHVKENLKQCILEGDKSVLTESRGKEEDDFFFSSNSHGTSERVLIRAILDKKRQKKK